MGKAASSTAGITRIDTVGYGPGRPPKALEMANQLKNYEKAISLLDDNIENALKTIVACMYDDDPYVRIRAAEIIIKKVIPDKKLKEVVGAGGQPIQIQNVNVDKRVAVLQVVDALDEIGLDDLKQRMEHGHFRLLDALDRGEECAEAGVPQGAEDEVPGAGGAGEEGRGACAESPGDTAVES